MAKFRTVPSLSPEETFLAGGVSPSDAALPLAIVPPALTSNTMLNDSSNDDDLEVVPLTIRIRRRHYDQLVKLAAAEERSLSQIARRILEPAIDSSQSPR